MNLEKYKRFQDYKFQLYDYIHWSKKKEYLSLIENFLEEETSFRRFIDDFSSLIWKNSYECQTLLKNLKELEKIKPSSESFRFETLMSGVYTRCHEYGQNESSLRQDLIGFIPEIKEYFV